VIAFVRVRNLTWLAIHLAATVSLAGVIVGFARDHGHLWTMTQLQWVLLAALAVVVLLAWLRPAPKRQSFRRQAATVLLPMAFVVFVVTVVTTFLTERPAFYNPLSYLIGHSVAEDNAKWLDFTSQLASGNPIEQAVSLGGPLQLMIVFVATALSVLSMVLLGGVNEVAVAANSVVFSEFLMVALVPLALAPIAEMRRPRGGAAPSHGSGTKGQAWIPWPMVVLAALVVGSASLLVTGFGHLTLQFTFLIMVLWSATFLANPKLPPGTAADLIGRRCPASRSGCRSTCSRSWSSLARWPRWPRARCGRGCERWTGWGRPSGWPSPCASGSRSPAASCTSWAPRRPQAASTCRAWSPAPAVP
jgi:hypothetical protein